MDVRRSPENLTLSSFASACAIAFVASVGCQNADRDHSPSNPAGATTTNVVIASSSSSAIDAGVAPMDAGPSTDPIHAIARPAAPTSLHWEAQSLPSTPSQVVLLSYDGAAQTLANLSAQLAWVDLSNAQAPVLIASADIEPNATACDESIGTDEEAPSFALDLAPYRITDRERAIGVRIACHQTFGAGEASRTELVLFARDARRPKSLQEIFRTSVADEEEQRGPGDSIDAQAIVSCGPQTTAQHFDLNVRRTIVITSLGNAPSRPASMRVTSERFVWNGTRYVGANKSP